jgi:hypothetical protein
MLRITGYPDAMPARQKLRKLTRKPWANVHHALAREVGFGCPVAGYAPAPTLSGTISIRSGMCVTITMSKA